jgi:hypothetical protein
VQRHPRGIAMGALYRCHRNFRKRELDEILASLETQEYIRQEEQSNASGLGRPSRLVVPVRGKKSRRDEMA